MIRDIELLRSIFAYLKAYKQSDNKTLTDVARRFGVTRQDIRRVMTHNNMHVEFAKQTGKSDDLEMAYRSKVMESVATITIDETVAAKHSKPLHDNKPQGKRRGKIPAVISDDKKKLIMENLHLPMTELIPLTGLSKYVLKTYLRENNLKRTCIEKPQHEAKRRGREPLPIPEDVQVFLRDNHLLPMTKLIDGSGISRDRINNFFRDKGLGRTKVKKVVTKSGKVGRPKKVVEPSKKRRGRGSTILPDDVQAFLIANAARPWKHLCKECGYTVPVVKKFLSEKGYTTSRNIKLPEDVKSFLKENYTRPWTHLVQECGYSISTIRSFMKDNGLVRPTRPKEVKLLKTRGKKPYEFSEEAKVIILNDFSRTIVSIARELGVSAAIVKRYLIDEGFYKVKPRKNKVS
jgi:predicted transcriptional regulator